MMKNDGVPLYYPYLEGDLQISIVLALFLVLLRVFWSPWLRGESALVVINSD